jgi:hypothetical protein
MGECAACPRSVRPSACALAPAQPAQRSGWHHIMGPTAERPRRNAQRSPLTGSCRLPVPAQNSNYLENGRYYHGYRRGIYQYPCDEVSRPDPDPRPFCNRPP